MPPHGALTTPCSYLISGISATAKRGGLLRRPGLEPRAVRVLACVRNAWPTEEGRGDDDREGMATEGTKSQVDAGVLAAELAGPPMCCPWLSLLARRCLLAGILRVLA